MLHRIKVGLLFLSSVAGLAVLLFRVCSLEAGNCASREPSLREMIGEMLMVGFAGTEISESDIIARNIVDHKIGGILVYEHPDKEKWRSNIESREQLIRLIETLQALRQRDGGSPLLVATDQEGGIVQRLKRLGIDSPAAAELGKAGMATQATYEQGEATAQQLKSLGINLNFAPDVDVAVDPDNFIVRRGRTYSGDPQIVAAHARAVVEAHRRVGVGCCLKHFPGHASSRADAHNGIADISNTWQREVELKPYQQLLTDPQGNPGMVMVGHVFHSGLDADYPASLSRNVIKHLLRDELGFDGVVITDDLGMKAIEDHYPLNERIKAVLAADVDIIMLGNATTYRPEETEEVVKLIETMVEQGEISRERLAASYQRIQRYKERIGLVAA